MRRLCLLFLPALLLACETTPNKPDPESPDGDITIDPDDLRPMRRFVVETRRVLAADFVRIEASAQYFEQLMAHTRDPRFVDRRNATLPDGTRVIELTNANKEQVTNIDPDLLPRVYFGNSGLEVRAYRAIRIYLHQSRDRERPLFLDIQAKNSRGEAKMWVSGRLQHEKPELRLRSALIWSEERERYVHRSSIG